MPAFDQFLGEQLIAFVQVVFIDLVLAGDNAVVVGMAAAGVPRAERRKVIFIGITAAVVLRIAFAAVTVQLLQIIGLTLAGGLLLLWVCWKLFRELREQPAEHAAIAEDGDNPEGDAAAAEPQARKSMGQAIWQITLADVSMSLDNVLAVAGAAKEHIWVLAAGLVLSIALMATVATLIARLLEHHRWIAYLGLAVIAYVAVSMIWEGTANVMGAVS